tara:strand:- start:1449 stop:1550 length:102 start_codon:yes stop_codon:yes gene_type:complete
MWKIVVDALFDLGIKIGILAVFLLTALAWALTN